MSILSPSLLADFSRTRALDPRCAFTRASGGLLRRADGAWAEAPSGASRFDHLIRSLGLMMEDQRVNLIRNPRGEGVVVANGVGVGSSTIATNWGIRAGSNYTLNVLGSGVEDGLPYIDVEYIGTGAHDIEIGFESLNAIALVSAGTYALGLFVRLISGSWTNITSANLRMRVDSPSGSNHATTSIMTANNGALARQRFIGAVAVASGATNGRMQLVIAGNGSSNITLRLSVPTCELGYWASSPILPAVGSPAATTRVADQAVYTLADFGVPAVLSNGTLLIAGRMPGGSNPPARQVLVRMDEGNTDNRIDISRETSGNIRTWSIVGGVTQSWSTSLIAVPPDGDFVYAAAWEPGALAISLNGAAPVVSAPASVPDAMIRLELGAFGASFARVAFWPQRVSNAALQSLAA